MKALGVVLAAAVVIVLIIALRKPGRMMELTLSGGFVGVREKYEYYPDGTIIFNDLREGRSIRSTMNEVVRDELVRRMRTLLEKYPDGLGLEPEGGADYYIYDLTIYSGDRVTVYYWADVIEGRSMELEYFASLLRAINSFASGRSKIVFYLKADSLVARRGETLRIRAVAVNPGKEDLPYSSPTP